METNENFHTQVIAKAWEDAEFKDSLIKNPIKTLESFVGRKLEIPEGKTIVVRDQSKSSTMYLNIPPSIGSTELTDDQLEVIAAGGLGMGVVYLPIASVLTMPKKSEDSTEN